MASRQFTVSFNIHGAMDGTLQAALNAAANAMRRLGNSARAASAAAAASRSGLQGLSAGLNQLSAAAQRYRQLQDALKQTSTDFSRTTASIQSARAKYEADAAAVEKLKNQLQQLRAAQQQAATQKASGNATIKQLRQDLQDLKRAYDLAKRAGDSLKMSSLDAQIKSTQAAIAAQNAQVKQAAEAYKQLSAQLKQTKADLQAANNAAKQSGSDLNSARTNAERLKAAFQQQLSALNQLKAQLSAAGFNVSNFAASEARLTADINRVNAALQRQAQLAAALARSRAASQDLAVSGANVLGSLYSAEQALSPFKTATEKAVEFERVMSEVKALTQMDNIKLGKYDVVEKEMSQLTSQAKELGATTIYTAQQVGEAQAFIARTGWDTNKILASTPHFLKLAASGHMDLARTADIATNIMTGFGISADQAEHVADVLAYTTTHSNQNLEEMGEALKYAAPVARMFGASLEETAAMTKFMADAGIKGSMAGTSLRQTMLRLVSPPKKATKAMQNMGLTVDDATAAWQNANAVAKEYGITMDASLTPGRQMLSIVKQIDEKMAGKSAHEKMAAFSAITGINAVSGALNLFEAGSKALDEFTTALENCDGALEQTYGVMTENTYGALKSMESAWEAVQISVGEAISPLVRSAAEAITPLLTSFSQWIDKHHEVVVAIAGAVASLSGLMVAAAGVKLAFAGWGFIVAQVALVRTAIAALANGALIGGLIGRFAALRAAMTGAFAAGGLATMGGWSAIGAGITAGFAKIVALATAARVAVMGFFTSLSVSSVAAGITSTLSSVGTAIAGVARAAMGFALSPVGAALMALALAGMYCYQNWDKVGPALSKVASIITGALRPAIITIGVAIDKISNAFNRLGNNSAIQELISTIGGGLVQAVVAAAGVIVTIIAVIIRAIADLVNIIADIGVGMADAFDKISKGDFSGAFESLSDTASKTATNIKNTFGDAWDTITTGFKTTAEAVEGVRIAMQDSFTEKGNKTLGQGLFSGITNNMPQLQEAAGLPPQQAVDTSQTQAGLDAVGESAQNAAQNMDGINQAAQALGLLPAQVQPATDSLAQLPAAVQPATDGMTQAGTAAQTLSTNAQQAATSAQALGTAAQGATGGITALGEAANGACAGTSSLGSAASGAAGAVSGLGAAAQAACAQLAAAGANAAAQVSAAAANVGKPAANYQGGIYTKGAFLTTFAEKSPEAAIPLDGSNRAKDLWTRAGEILGILPQTSTPSFDTTITTPPFVPPDIKLPEGQQISYSGQRELPSREKIRQQKMPDVFAKLPPLPTVKNPRPTRARTQRPQLPKMPTSTVGTNSSTSTVEKIFTTVTSSIFEKFSSTKVGGILEKVTTAIFDAPKLDMPNITTQTTPPFVPPENKSKQLPIERWTTPPFVPNQPQQSPLEMFAGDGGGLVTKLHETFAIPNETSYRNDAPINFTINVTVTGGGENVEAQARRGIEQSLPKLQSFAEQLRDWEHERSRVSFA